MLTEDEAKTMWCPMYRCAPHGTNADADGGRRDTCVASRCMMWRKATERMPTDGGSRYYASEKRGFCGLAGEARW